MDKQVSVDQVYNDFWKDIVEEEGEIVIDQIKRELYDFSTLIDNVSEVYCHVTGNQISKPLTDPDVVCSLTDEYYNEICLEHIEDMKAIEEHETKAEAKHMINLRDLKTGLTYWENCLFLASAVLVGLFVVSWLLGLLS